MPDDAASLIDPELLSCLQANAGRPAWDLARMAPEEARRVYAESREPWNRGVPDMAEVRRSVLDGAGRDLPFVAFTPFDARPGTLVYLHGGGWVVGSVATHDGIMRGLAARSGRRVIGLDYPLAPESRRSEVLATCVAAVERLQAERAEPLMLAGDSAGGELSLAVALALRDRDRPLPAGLVLAYPALWPRFDTASHVRCGDGRFGLSSAKMRDCWALYLGGEPALPEALDLTGLPPCYLLGAALDCLLDDARDLTSFLEEAGVAHRFSVPEGSVHGFLHYAEAAAVAGHALDDIAGFVRDRLSNE